jgi:tetratricopeptide (TPR) repeat protein
MLRILLVFGIFIILLGCLSQPAEEILSLAKIQEQSSLQEAIALGNAGEQQENNQRYDEALHFTRQAIFKAQAAQVNVKERHLALAWLIRWHWQLGRILQAQNQIEAAIEAYQQALHILVPENEKAFQWDTKSKDNVSLYKELRQIFLQLADLRLQRAATRKTEEQQADLSLARDTIEKLKIVGLDTYFGGCLPKKIKKPIAHFNAPQTAVIYPILLPERLELLVSFSVQNKAVIFRETVAVSENTINEVIRDFRIQLKKGRNSPENEDYLNEAQQLYRWLVAPLLPRFRQHDINTLIFVPEDILNALPIAALHDDDAFIIEEFAVAITPTLNLTEATQERKLTPSETKVLLSAITEAVQNYSALPYVQNEIQTVNKWYRPKMLLNKEFTSENFADRLTKFHYDFIHIISHAEFTEKVADSFIFEC